MRRLLGKLTGLFAILVFLLISQLATTNVVVGKDLRVDEIGVLDGVPYKIKVPTNWNKILLVYAHGYIRYDSPTLVPIEIKINELTSGTDLEKGLLDRGYALAASSYRNAGWAVKEGIEDTKNLTEFFSEHVKKPKLTILWGSSMGSAVTLKSIEDHADIYDGAIVLSHLGAGTSLTFDKTLAIALAYDVALGWPEEDWGSVGDVHDDLDFNEDVAPVLMEQVYDFGSDPSSNPFYPLNPANFGKFEFLRLVNRLPYEGFYQGEVPLNLWLFGDMFFATGARAELEARAGGPVAQNLNHTYTLNEYDKGYLAYLGVKADKLLSKMNKQTNVEADPSARNYLKEYADFSGELQRPVLTLQPKWDGMTVPANSTVYQETVEASGASNLLVQKYTEGNMHVVFTPEQVYAAFEAMESWLNTGIPPDDDFFPTAMGFDNGYTPPDWPQPTE